jgi:hypothetical protein
MTTPRSGSAPTSIDPRWASTMRRTAAMLSPDPAGSPGLNGSKEVWMALPV